MRKNKTVWQHSLGKEELAVLNWNTNDGRDKSKCIRCGGKNNGNPLCGPCQKAEDKRR